jgi:citrate synthase
MTLLSEPDSIQGAVASGLLGVGSRFAGAMEECAAVLQEVQEDDDIDAEDIVARYRSDGDAFPGIGHRNFDPVDPRAERLLELADEANEAHLPGVHTDVLLEIQAAFEAELDMDLPVNVTGAIASLSSGMGFTPPAARGIAVVSRAAGLVAEALDEQASPDARAMWELVEREFEEEPAKSSPSGE